MRRNVAHTKRKRPNDVTRAALEREPDAVTSRSQPFSAASKKVLELALREALQLGHNYIADFHILLALIRSAESTGDEFATLIENAGLSMEPARVVAMRSAPVAAQIKTGKLRRQRDVALGNPGSTPGLEAVLRVAVARSGAASTTTGDLLAALLEVPGTHAELLLANADLPDRASIEAEADRLRAIHTPDGYVERRVTVDKKTGAITINDPRITELMKRPVEEQSQAEHDALADLVAEALAEAREQQPPTAE